MTQVLTYTVFLHFRPASLRIGLDITFLFGSVIYLFWFANGGDITVTYKYLQECYYVTILAGRLVSIGVPPPKNNLKCITSR